MSGRWEKMVPSKVITEKEGMTFITKEFRDEEKDAFVGKLFRNFTFEDCRFEKVDFNRCTFIDCTFKDIICQPGYVQNFRGAIFVNCFFEEWSGITETTLFDEMTTNGCYFTNMHFYKCGFNKAHFVETTLINTDFLLCELSGAVFDSCSLNGETAKEHFVGVRECVVRNDVNFVNCGLTNIVFDDGLEFKGTADICSAMYTGCVRPINFNECTLFNCTLNSYALKTVMVKCVVCDFDLKKFRLVESEISESRFDGVKAVQGFDMDISISKCFFKNTDLMETDKNPYMATGFDRSKVSIDSETVFDESCSLFGVFSTED